MSRLELPPSKPVHPFDALATIGCVYLALVTFGFASFMYLNVLPTGAKHQRDLAFFTSSNAVTLTGFSQVNAAVPNYPTFGLALLSGLATASALTSLIGGGYLLARALRLRISLPALVSTSIAIIIVPALALCWTAPFDAIASSVGLGLSTTAARSTAQTVFSVGGSAFGLLGVLPLLSLVSRDRANAATSHRFLLDSVFAVAALVIVGTLLLLACGLAPTATGTASLALRGFGPTGTRFDASPSLPWAASILAIFGAAPASTGGGLSVLPIVILVRGAIDALRQRTIDPQVGVAVAWLFSFAVIVVAAVLGLAELAPSLSADRIIPLAFGAIGNVSTSAEPLGLTGASLFLLSAAMLAGRLLPFAMLAWMACLAERESPSLSS